MSMSTSRLVRCADSLARRAFRTIFPRPSIRIPLFYKDVVRWIGKPRSYGSLQRLLSKNDAFFASLLREMSKYTGKLFQISLSAPSQNNDTEPWFGDTSYFSHMDAVALYLLVAHYRPRRILEIGSGTSTKYMRRAVRDWNLATEIVSIDPSPRAAIDAICDQVIRQNVLDVPGEFFTTLGANDFLFIDGSHLVFAGTDLPYIFLEILPRLSNHVIIHFHDIFLPEDYPSSPEWQRMYYNEQYLLAAFLLHNAEYSVILPNYYLSTYRPELIAQNLDLTQAPQTDQVHFQFGGSFWLRKSTQPY